MLALVTCHIFPPSIWYGKKWITGTWLPGWQLAVFRVHGFTSAVRQMPTQCATLLHGQMYLQEKTPVLQFGHTLEQNSSICPSISYLWMVDLVMRFFSCGASLWRSSTRIRPKKGPAPWILFLTPAPRPLQVTFFWVGEAEHMWLYPFCKDKCIFRKKTPVLQFGRVDTKFSNSSHHVLSVDDWPGDATFFLWANLWRLSASIQSKKGPAPWILFLTPAPRPLQVTFLVGEAEHVCLYPFARTTVFSAKKHVFCNLGARWHKILEFGPSCPISGLLAWWCDFFPVGQPLKIIRKYSVKKGPAPWILFLTPAPLPLEVTFLVGEGEHMWLYPFCKVI